MGKISCDQILNLCVHLRRSFKHGGVSKCMRVSGGAAWYRNEDAMTFCTEINRRLLSLSVREASPSIVQQVHQI